MKSLTTQTFFFYAQQYQIPISRFVIPNPFGILDNPKLLHYLSTEWLKKRTPIIQTPVYIRDNIPVDLLAFSYLYWLKKQSLSPETVFEPSGYQSSMADFAKRVATELSDRLGLPCPLLFKTQTDFSQPHTLINSTPAPILCPQWNEKSFWDSLALDILSRKKT